MNEARIDGSNTVLLALADLADDVLVRDFCGSVVTADDLSAGRARLTDKTVYVYGDASNVDLDDAAEVIVVRDPGRLPLRVHGVGVFHRRFFDPGVDYFERVRSEHVFQSLTESTKSAKAHRSGIYLTPVERRGEDLHFRLLRCSTNLSGPTENFRATDWHIVDALNQEAARLFEDHAALNHVLAQVYYNKPATEERRQTKAKISSHADKTKDMPDNGIMAFCTFYDGLDALHPMPDDPFDYGYKRTSGLTRLAFRLKAPTGDLPAEFSITLYPGSVFLMPLSTNRLYTHEIRSSALDAARLPTRLGYVVRCSATEAVHKDGATFLENDGALTPLEPPTPEGMGELRGLYADENKTDAFIEYGDRFRFSMNEGDYRAPDYDVADEFRRYTVSDAEGLFETLSAAVRFEDVTKGRQGAVLVAPDEKRGTPIVRTTTKYDVAAQRFGDAYVRLADRIRTCASLSVRFNNALVERYTNDYFKMGFHSDQALDLEDGSFVAIFSCYENPAVAALRTLVVEPMEPGGGTFEIPLTHNSVIVFSLETNRRHRHKIVLDRSTNPPSNRWLGVTLRTSRTFVRFGDKGPSFEDGTRITLADDDEAREFYRLRGRENREPDFVYPRITYTISKSDLIAPTT